MDLPWNRKLNILRFGDWTVVAADLNMMRLQQQRQQGPEPSLKQEDWLRGYSFDLRLMELLPEMISNWLKFIIMISKLRWLDIQGVKKRRMQANDEGEVSNSRYLSKMRMMEVHCWNWLRLLKTEIEEFLGFHQYWAFVQL